ncbi:dihydropteroate synthase [Escherichia coli]
MQLISKGLLSLERPPHVMGILNVTPDSFSDGGIHFNQIERAMAHARQMVSDGATLIDIGGESTRPGAPDVNEQEELDRVIPVVERLVAELRCDGIPRYLQGWLRDARRLQGGSPSHQ